MVATWEDLEKASGIRTEEIDIISLEETTTSKNCRTTPYEQNLYLFLRAKTIR